MSNRDLNSLILRGRDLLWCLALSDVNGHQGERWILLNGLRTLEMKSQRLGEQDLYSAIVRDLEAHANRQV
jgi:hypothetical protein